MPQDKPRDAMQRPPFREALRFWFKLGWISFGGTAAHIAIMHDELVQKKRWISNGKFLHALSHCMVLPGPEAQQLAIYIGWKLHGKRGGFVAGALFVLPSMFVLLALSAIYVRFGNLPWIAAMFSGLKPAVIALVVVSHLRRLATISDYLGRLTRSTEGAVTVPPPSGGAGGATADLHRAAAEAGRHWSARRRELEAVVAANEAVIASLPDPLIMLDRARRIVRANQAAETALGTALAGEGALGVRLLGPLSVAAASLLLVDAGECLLPGRRAGLRAAALLNATLLFGVGTVIMTPDTPLLFFWTCCLWATARLLRSDNPRWWLAVGLFAGLAMDSKYTAGLLWFGIGVWLLATPSVRCWLQRPAPWLGAVFGVAVFMPVVLWNADHGWTSFARQGGRIDAWHPAPDRDRHQPPRWWSREHRRRARLPPCSVRGR